MDKKRVFLVLVSLVFIILFSNIAFAQEEGLGGVADTFHKLFGFIPDIITIDKLVGADTAALFWAKFLVWLLIFGATYYGAGFVFKEQKRIAVVVALAFSFIGVLGIPNDIIINVFQTYGLAAGVVVWFVPVIGGLFLAHKIDNKAGKVMFYFLLIVVMLSMDKTLTSTGGLLEENLWIDYFRLLWAVVVLAFFWNLVAMFGGGAAEEAAAARLGDARRDFGDWLGGRRDDEIDEGGRGGGGGRGDDRGGTRPPGRTPPPTPARRYPTDPPTPRIPPPGIDPRAPVIRFPREPTKPKIPDEKVIEIDLSSNFNEIRSQGDTSSCTAFAATSVFEYIFNTLGVSNHTKRDLSPLFLWYLTRKSEGKEHENRGVSPSNALNILQKDGVCFEELWSFNNFASIWNQAPSRDAERDALSKKIREFRELDRDDPDQWIHQLLEDNPCFIGMSIPDDFRYFRPPLYTNNNPTFRRGDYHAMVIVGYHSHYPYEGRGIKAFKIRNSWDVNWGENGYIWVPADLLLRMIPPSIPSLGVWIFKGWRRESQREPRENEEETEELLEQIKKYANDEIGWLAAEYNYLEPLKESVEEEDYPRANSLMRSVGRSENMVDGFEQRIEENLSELKRNIQGRFRPAIDDIDETLKVLARSLVKLTSRHRGDIRQKLNVLMETSKADKDYPAHKNALKEMIDDAIHNVRGLDAELEKLLNLEEYIHRDLNSRRE